MFLNHRTSSAIKRLSVVRLSAAAALILATPVGTAIAQTGCNNCTVGAPQLLPYIAKLVAGGGTTTTAAGAKCPVSGFTATDAYGDGCLATEIQLGNVAAGAATPGARDAVADSNGNIFLTDYQNGLVRRVDAVTGVVTAIAGGSATSPAAGAACGTLSSTDARGDGCLGTAVHLSHPAIVIFSPAGDLYFSDTGYGEVRKIAATSGFVPATGGVISLVMGNVATTYGYAASNASTTINPGTSYLRAPLGLAFDASGDLFVADEYYYAVLVLNTSSSTNTVNGVTIPAGTISKVAGTVKTGGPFCLNGTTSSSGCSNAAYVAGSAATATYLYNPFGIALDPNGNLYIANEYYDSIPYVSTSGVINTFAGIENTVAKPAATTRGQAGSFAIGSSFGVAADSFSNVYITDASSGLIWRVDGGSQKMFVVAGGAKTATVAGSPCPAPNSSYIATDAVGDGCPATQAILGSSGTTFATTTLPGPGVYGVHTDANSNIYFGDTIQNVVREISSNTQFGVVGANQPTQTLLVHYAAGDGPAATKPYVITSVANNFKFVSQGTCVTNSDNTTDCPVVIQATPSTLGTFTGTLTVTSSQNKASSFTLGGTYAQSPKTRLAVTYSDSTTVCSGTSTYSSADTILLTGTLTANGPNPPNGTVTFFANGAQIGTPQNVSNIGTTANPVYGATLSYVFSTPNSYTITAVYSGDTTAPIYFTGSTGSAAGTLISAVPSFTAAATAYQQSTVVAGQTGLYSFTLTQSVYTGTINLACSGLPANSTCSFSPSSITATGCSTSNTVALSILTQGGVPGQTAIGLPGRGPLQLLTMLFGIALALAIGLRRRRLSMGGLGTTLGMALALVLASSGLMACSNTVNPLPVTPSGSYTVTVTATGSASNVTSSFTVPLVVK